MRHIPCPARVSTVLPLSRDSRVTGLPADACHATGSRGGSFHECSLYLWREPVNGLSFGVYFGVFHSLRFRSSMLFRGQMGIGLDDIQSSMKQRGEKCGGIDSAPRASVTSFHRFPNAYPLPPSFLFTRLPAMDDSRISSKVCFSIFKTSSHSINTRIFSKCLPFIFSRCRERSRFRLNEIVSGRLQLDSYFVVTHKKAVAGWVHAAV